MLLLCCLLQSCSAAADMLSADMLSALQSCSAAADMLSAAELFGCCCYAVYCRAVRLLLICYLLQSCSAAALKCCLLQSCTASAGLLSRAAHLKHRSRRDNIIWIAPRVPPRENVGHLQQIRVELQHVALFSLK